MAGVTKKAYEEGVGLLGADGITITDTEINYGTVNDEAKQEALRALLIEMVIAARYRETGQMLAHPESDKAAQETFIRDGKNDLRPNPDGTLRTNMSRGALQDHIDNILAMKGVPVETTPGTNVETRVPQFWTSTAVRNSFSDPLRTAAEGVSYTVTAGDDPTAHAIRIAGEYRTAFSALNTAEGELALGSLNPAAQGNLAAIQWLLSQEGRKALDDQGYNIEDNTAGRVKFDIGADGKLLLKNSAGELIADLSSITNAADLNMALSKPAIDAAKAQVEGAIPEYIRTDSRFKDLYEQGIAKASADAYPDIEPDELARYMRSEIQNKFNEEPYTPSRDIANVVVSKPDSRHVRSTAKFLLSPDGAKAFQELTGMDINSNDAGERYSFASPGRGDPLKLTYKDTAGTETVIELDGVTDKASLAAKLSAIPEVAVRKAYQEKIAEAEAAIRGASGLAVPDQDAMIAALHKQRDEQLAAGISTDMSNPAKMAELVKATRHDAAVAYMTEKPPATNAAFEQIRVELGGHTALRVDPARNIKLSDGTEVRGDGRNVLKMADDGTVSIDPTLKAEVGKDYEKLGKALAQSIVMLNNRKGADDVDAAKLVFEAAKRAGFSPADLEKWGFKMEDLNKPRMFLENYESAGTTFVGGVLKPLEDALKTGKIDERAEVEDALKTFGGIVSKYEQDTDAPNENRMPDNPGDIDKSRLRGQKVVDGIT